jgi:release factor glutamine methyltransferase
MHKIYSYFISKIRNNKTICYFLFGICYENNSYGGYWDWVTIELRNFLRQHKHKLTSLLDLGTGPYGILSLYAHKLNENCKIVGADYCKELIENIETINTSHKIKFIHSDLFKNINEKFDFIVFNAPYIDLDFGEKIGVLQDEMSIKRWSGGKNGIETISRFLFNVKKYINTEGICALGVNEFYVEDKIIIELIEKANLNLQSVSRNMFTKANVYIIKTNQV